SETAGSAERLPADRTAWFALFDLQGSAQIAPSRRLTRHRQKRPRPDELPLLGGQRQKLVLAQQLLAKFALVFRDLTLDFLIPRRLVHPLDIALQEVVNRLEGILIDPLGLFSSMSLNEKYGVPERSMIPSTVV